MKLIVAIAFGVHALYWVALRAGFRRAASGKPVSPSSDVGFGQADEGSVSSSDVGFKRAAHEASASPSEVLPPMSVIVAARNEVHNLPELLHALERQLHPRYEIVIVDDGSTDGSSSVLDDWKSRLSNLRIVRTGGFGKKLALTKGIEAAKFDLLAFTDADCRPPARWLSVLAREHSLFEGGSLLIGFSPFEAPPRSSLSDRASYSVRESVSDRASYSDRASMSDRASLTERSSFSDRGSLSDATRSAKGFVARLARYETFVTGFLTVAAVGWGRPYMAVGRNISYSRSLFERLGGFERIMHSLSGDDDLFVQDAARRSDVEIRAVLDPDSFVPTPPPSSLREWIRQKHRHASAGRFYSPGIQAHLAAFHGSNLLVWLAPFLVGWLGFGMLAAKLALKFGVLRGAAKMLREDELMRFQPLLEPVYVLYNVLIAPLGLMRMPEKW